MDVYTSTSVCEHTGIWRGLSDWVLMGENFLAQKNLAKYLVKVLRYFWL